MNDHIKDKLARLPSEPGCYLMKNAYNEIIYVGKAKKLKNRVSSYFTGSHDNKTTKLVSQIVDFDFIITMTEKESLILEINLIKEHRPRYNILFMDDKMYPYIRLNKTGLPELKVVRDRKMSPNYYYFGPYPDAGSARRMVSVLNNAVPIDGVFKPNMKGVYDQFNRSSYKYSAEELEHWRQALIRILNGNIKDFTDDLTRQMLAASSAMNFELAQRLKERIAALQATVDKQRVQLNLKENFDMFNYSFHQGYIAIVGLFVRQGRLLERSMTIEASLEEPEDAFVSYISQFYQSQPKPKRIYVPNNIALDLMSELLDMLVEHAYRGNKRSLMDMGAKNARQRLLDQFAILETKDKYRHEALLELARRLEISKPIHRIEVFDNSHLSGTFTVSACVVYDDGEPNKNLYRRYKLHQGNNDTEAIYEVVYRRYLRLLKEDHALPDLILIDGGPTQLEAAKRALNDLDLGIDLAALVKDDYHRTYALINKDKALIEIKDSQALFTLLGQMQDEVHRFAITYHKTLRKKSMTKSILNEVSGLGPKRQKELYKHFKSLKGMRAASIEDLAKHLPLELAKDLYAHLHFNEEEKEDE